MTGETGAADWCVLYEFAPGGGGGADGGDGSGPPGADDPWWYPPAPLGGAVLLAGEPHGEDGTEWNSSCAPLLARLSECWAGPP